MKKYIAEELQSLVFEGGVREFDSLDDAKTYVDNMGVVDWDWDGEPFEEVMHKLAKHFRANADGKKTEETLLKSFIKDVLKQDPKNYSL